MPLDLNGNKLLSTSIGPKGEVIKSIVTDGLLCHLDAGNKNSYNGSGTTWTDLSGNGYNATLVNSVGYDSNGYLTFNGSNGYVITNSISNYKSFSLWAYINDNTTNYLLDARTGSPNGWVWHGSTGTDWNQWFINGTSATVSMQSLPTNQWFHLYMRNTGIRTGTITLMARYTFGENKVGKYGIFGVYNRELSITEILQNYNSQKSRFGL